MKVQSVVIEAKDLTIGYRHGKRGEVVHSHLNFALCRGELTCLLGSNGAGKSTLGYVLTGNPKYSVTEGKILFKGNDITEEAADKRAKAGMFLSFQEPLEVPGTLPRELYPQCIERAGQK